MNPQAVPSYVPAPTPEDEAARLADLRDYAVLDTPPEQAFEELTSLASAIIGTPMALVSLVDSQRQWFKSRVGFEPSETSRDISFCAHAILGTTTFVVEDAALDPRFAGNPVVVGEPHVRFYAGTPLETPGGHRVGTLCVLDRVPRRLSARDEDALRIIARQVMTQLELRKAGIALRRQREHLVSVARLKDEFVSVVSHELRTPLTSIKGSLQLLVSSAIDDAEERDTLQRIALSNVERLIRLINDILDISKIEAGRMELKRQPVMPGEMIAAALRSVSQFAADANVTVTSPVPAELIAVTVDVDQIVRALVNLIANAVKFSPCGATVVVTVSQEPGELVLAVTDSGPGIPADQQERLFQKFSQLDSSDSRAASGTGLGLAITKGIVERHGGKITVRSAPGQGSTFTIRLPSAQDDSS